MKAKLETIPEEPAQGAAEQSTMTLCELNGITQLERFRHNLSSMHCIIGAEPVDFSDCFTDPPPHIQTRVELVRSRVRPTWVDPNTGYFHPFLNEWRPFPSGGNAKRKSWFGVTDIIAKYSKIGSGLEKAGKYAISLPVDGSLMF